MTGAADDEYWVLTHSEGRAILAEAAGVLRPGPSDISRWRRRADGGRVAAAVRLAEARRRGGAKFARASSMWLEKTGLEQATAEAVARHKAARFAGGLGVVFDLCCGIGGDALTLAGHAEVVAVDRDAAMCRRAAWNAEVYGVSARVAAVRARAESIEVPRGAWVHVDPDRRAGRASRAWNVVDYAPGPDFLHSLAGSTDGGAFKLGPSSDFEAVFPPETYETEVVSLDGECKEATAWFGAAVTCARRATCLPAGATWTDHDAPADSVAAVGPILGYILDPDPALVRSGLLDGFATAHGLSRVVEGCDYLGSGRPINSPFVSAFEVVAVLPIDLRRLRAELVARCVGPLDVKTRGVALTPDEVRGRLRLRGENPATLLLAGGPSGTKAVVARRLGKPSGTRRVGE